MFLFYPFPALPLFSSSLLANPSPPLPLSLSLLPSLSISLDHRAVLVLLVTRFNPCHVSRVSFVPSTFSVFIRGVRRSSSIFLPPFGLPFSSLCRRLPVAVTLPESRSLCVARYTFDRLEESLSSRRCWINTRETRDDQMKIPLPLSSSSAFCIV